MFISLDKNLLDEKQGDVLLRHLRYAEYVEHLLVIVLTTRKDGFSKSLHKKNLLVIPTNSRSRWYFVRDGLRIAKKLTRKTGFHLVSAQDPFITAVIGVLIKRQTGAALNIQLHNDFSSPYWMQERLQNRLMAKITLRFADSVRAVSKITAKIRPSGSNIFIAPISVDLNFFRPVSTEKAIDVISVGRLVKQKNFSLLLEAIASLAEDFPKLRVKIVGEGPQKKHLNRLLDENNLGEHVELVGAQSRARVRELLQKSKVFVLPSNYEGWGLAAVEAAGCGLPVVMTDTGGASEIVKDGETGYIVPVDNGVKLEERLRELLKNSKLRKRMGEKGRNWIETNFQREILEKQWIEGLISKSKRKSKVCFIVPELYPDTATHYLYSLKLFDEFAKEYPAALLIEKGEPLKESHKFEKVVIQNISIKPLNLIERFILLSKLRLDGFTTFYIHYSYWSLFLLKIISIALPTKILYWHAEEFHKKDLEKTKLLERFLLKTSIKAAPTLVTAGENLKKAYAETFDISANKIMILPNWIELKPQKENKKALRKKLGMPQKKKLILFVHRLSERKGAHLLPEIINKIHKEARNVHFLIIGSGPLKKFLEKKVHKEDATFAGDVPQRKIHEYYQAADVFLMPSLREGFPRVVVEAMAAGLPIVTSNVGEVSSILPNEQKEYIVTKGKVSKFVYALQRIIKDGKARRVLGDHNQARAKKFNLKNSTNHLVSLIGKEL